MEGRGVGFFCALLPTAPAIRRERTQACAAHRAGSAPGEVARARARKRIWDRRREGGSRGLGLGLGRAPGLAERLRASRLSLTERGPAVRSPVRRALDSLEYVDQRGICAAALGRVGADTDGANEGAPAAPCCPAESEANIMAASVRGLN